jgi:hypothetical protein
MSGRCGPRRFIVASRFGRFLRFTLFFLVPLDCLVLVRSFFPFRWFCVRLKAFPSGFVFIIATTSPFGSIAFTAIFFRAVAILTPSAAFGPIAVTFSRWYFGFLFRIGVEFGRGAWFSRILKGVLRDWCGRGLLLGLLASDERERICRRES